MKYPRQLANLTVLATKTLTGIRKLLIRCQVNILPHPS